MKITIDQKVLVRALERGAMAALSDEAQGDSSDFQNLVQSVKITVDDNFTVESGTPHVATKWSIKATKENGIEVKEHGTALVPAKDLHGWASKQNKAKIALSLSVLKTPEVIKGSGGSDLDYGSGQATSVKKVGNLNLISRDDTKTGNKWKLPSYEAVQSSVDFSQAPDSVITIPTTQLTEGLKNVGFSSQPKDYQHIFDSIALERYDGSVYLAATDTHRCSLYKLDKATNIDETFFTESSLKVGASSYGQKILIPSVFLKSVSKFSESSEVSISYDKAKSKVYLIQDEWSVRVATIDSAMFNSFPTIASLIKKPYSRLGNIQKSVLINRLVSASLVNKQMVLFDFQTDTSGASTDGSVIIRAISEVKLAPNVSNAPVSNLTKSVKAVWGVQHLMDVMKVLKDDDVSFFIPDDMKSVKVMSEEDPNLLYYSMVINNAKYAPFFEEEKETQEA
jgi:DNA polymerase III sliding clamp (beta) subunit (PCNA family)